MLPKWERPIPSLAKEPYRIKGGEVASKRGGKGRGPGAWQTSTAYRALLKKLVEARDAAGLTQRDLAAKLGKQPSWIAKIEGRERRLDVIEYIAICRALGIDEGLFLNEISGALPRRLEI